MQPVCPLSHPGRSLAALSDERFRLNVAEIDFDDPAPSLGTPKTQSSCCGLPPTWTRDRSKSELKRGESYAHRWSDTHTTCYRCHRHICQCADDSAQC